MEEVPARIKLHLIQLTHKPEMDHSAHSFACYNLRVSSTLVDGLKLAECCTYRGSNQDGGLLLLE